MADTPNSSAGEPGAAPVEGSEQTGRADTAGRAGSLDPLGDLLAAAQLAGPHRLPELLAQTAATLGFANPVVYLADLQQLVLAPFVGSAGPALGHHLEPLRIDSTVAGKAFQRQQVAVSAPVVAGDGLQLLLPVSNGAERLGVLAVSLSPTETPSGSLGVDLTWSAADVVPSADLQVARRLASVTGQLIVSRTFAGDTIVRVRRRAEMGLAAEIQWALLPPLSFASDEVVIAAALEPAYEIGGDAVDYAVDDQMVRLAMFDGMGHGLGSAQLATVSVAAYRNARRAGRSLGVTAHVVDEAIQEGFPGDVFTTAVLAELDTETGILSWVNAGHPPPLLMRPGQPVTALPGAPALPFGLAGQIAALMDPSTATATPTVNGDSDFPVATHQLQPGDSLIFYTDGVTDSRTPSGELFGRDRLVTLLQHADPAQADPAQADPAEADPLPAAELMRRVVSALLEHQHARLTDDATLMLVQYRHA